MRQRAEEVYRKKGEQNKRWKHYTCIYLVRSVSIILIYPVLHVVHGT